MHDLRPVMFTVPGEPVGKGRPRIGRVGAHARMFTPSKTANYEGLIAHSGQQAMAGRALFEGDLAEDEAEQQLRRRMQAQGLDGLSGAQARELLLAKMRRKAPEVRRDA